MASLGIEGQDDYDVRIDLSADPFLGFTLLLEETASGDVDVRFDYSYWPNQGIDRFFLRLPTTRDEMLWGAGEQATYLNLRGRTFPVWVTEQGVGRNKSDVITGIVDWAKNAGGDYWTTYWPQASFLSSRKYYFQVGRGLPTVNL